MADKICFRQWTLSRILFLVLLFFVSVNSSFSSNTTIGGLAVMVILAGLGKKFPLPLFVQVCALCVVLFASLYLNFKGMAGSDYSDSIVFRYMVTLVFLPMIILCFFLNRRSIVSSIGILVRLHIYLFFLQFVFSLIGVQIDYLEIAGIRESRNQVYLDGSGAIFSMRASGLFHEPGTYGSVVGALLAGLICISRKTVNERLVVLFVVSCVLSLSTFGVLAAVAVLTLFYSDALTGIISSLRKMIFLGFIVFFAFIYMYFRFSENSLISSGLGARLIIINEYLNFGLHDFLFGASLEESKILIEPERHYEFFVEDNGLLFYMLFLHGFLLTCVSVFLLSTIGGINKRFLLCCAILKISPAFYFFSLILIPAFLVSNCEREVISGGDR